MRRCGRGRLVRWRGCWNWQNKGINKDLDEYREGFDLSESEITFMILPVIGAVIFFIFFISSIVALVKGPKLKQVENTQI